jgi:imidazolonepropionase-like amidohydrolase
LMDALSDLGYPQAVSPAGTPAAAGTPASPRAAVQPQTPPVKGPEDRPASTPWVQAADEIKLDDKRWESWRNAGFTSVMSAPKQGLMPGQGSVLMTAGTRMPEMVIKTPASVVMSFQPLSGSFPGSLMGVLAYVKQTLLDVKQSTAAQKLAGSHPKDTPMPPYDRTLRALQEAMDANRLFLLPATTAPQMDRALELAQSFNLRVAIYGAQQAYGMKNLSTRKTPVLLNAKWPARDKMGDPEAEENLRTLEFREKAPSSAAALDKAGVPFGFYSDGQTPAEFIKAVKKSIDAGLRKDAAIRALTLGPAEMLGVADRVGSIEPGKLANLLISSGDLFDPKSKVKFVFVAGVKFDVPDKPTPPKGEGKGTEEPKTSDPQNAHVSEVF